MIFFSDYKTALQEVTQAKFAITPEYRLERSFGPDHQKEFEISIWIDDKNYGKAIGKSKKMLQLELAIIMFIDYQISSPKAANFANLSLIEFRQELAKKKYFLNYQ